MKKQKNLPKPISIWQSLGPSFVMLGLALGSGELVLWPYLSANWGLGLLWGALLGITFQFILNTEVMRYSLAWGESVFAGFRRMSIVFPIWFLISTFIPWSLPGFSSAASEIITVLVPWMPTKLVAIGLLLLTGLILSSGKTVYSTIEKFQKTIIFVGLPFLFILTIVLSTQTDWLEVVSGMVGKGDGWWFFPQGVAIASFLGAFAYAGAGGNLNLAQSYYVKEKGFGMGAYSQKMTSLFSGKQQQVQLMGQTFTDTSQNRKLWNKWWKLVVTEHFIVFWLLGFISIVMLSVLAKTTVFGQEVGEGLGFLYLQAEAIGARTHQIFGTFFLLASALMLFSTQVGVLESSSRILSENILLLFSTKKRKINLSLVFYIALWSQIGIGILIYLFGIQEPRLLLTLAAILNAAAMMVSFVLIGILNRRYLKKYYQPTLLRKAILFIAVLFFAYLLSVTVGNNF